MHTNTGFSSLTQVQCARAATKLQSSGQPKHLMASLAPGMSLLPALIAKRLGLFC